MPGSKLTKLLFAALMLAALGPHAAWAQTRAALVRDVDRELAQPVNGYCSAVTDSSGVAICKLYSVPAGKRLKIEMLSYQVVVSSGQVLYSMLVGKNAGSSSIAVGLPNVHFVAIPTGVTFSGLTLYVGSTPVSLFFDEADDVMIQATRSGGANSTCYFTFSGYLVDKN